MRDYTRVAIVVTIFLTSLASLSGQGKPGMGNPPPASRSNPLTEPNLTLSHIQLDTIRGDVPAVSAANEREMVAQQYDKKNMERWRALTDKTERCIAAAKEFSGGDTDAKHAKEYAKILQKLAKDIRADFATNIGGPYRVTGNVPKPIEFAKAQEPGLNERERILAQAAAAVRLASDLHAYSLRETAPAIDAKSILSMHKLRPYLDYEAQMLQTVSTELQKSLSKTP